MTFPQWATPERRNFLVELFLESRGFCVYGHGMTCLNPHHHYELVIDDRIEEFKRSDREERSYLWKLLERRLHAAPNKRIQRGPFDSIRREQYLAARPIFLVVGIGVNAFTQRRVAKVEIPGLEKVIWVDLSGVEVSKRRLRKLSRRPGGNIPDAIYSRIAQAVRRYYS